MATAILRLPTVKARTGLSRSTIYLRISEGRFPKPVSLGGRAVGWIEAEINDWLNQQIEASRTVTAEGSQEYDHKNKGPHWLAPGDPEYSLQAQFYWRRFPCESDHRDTGRVGLVSDWVGGLDHPPLWHGGY